MTNLSELVPDIKVSVNQIFGIDTEMKVDGFSKKMNMFLKLIAPTNLIEILPWPSFQDLHLISVF